MLDAGNERPAACSENVAWAVLHNLAVPAGSNVLGLEAIALGGRMLFMSSFDSNQMLVRKLPS